MAFVARSKWRQDQRDIALAGGKPDTNEPDWGLDKPSHAAASSNPQDSMSFEELKSHYAERKKLRPKSLAEMRARGVLKGVSE